MRTPRASLQVLQALNEAPSTGHREEYRSAGDHAEARARLTDYEHVVESFGERNRQLQTWCERVGRACSLPVLYAYAGGYLAGSSWFSSCGDSSFAGKLREWCQVVRRGSIIGSLSL